VSQTRKGVRPSLVGEACVFTPAALECGTLTIKPMRDRVRQYNSCFFGRVGVEPRAGERVGPGTLLGPEISVAQLLLVRGCRRVSVRTSAGHVVWLGCATARVLRTSQWTRASL